MVQSTRPSVEMVLNLYTIGCMSASMLHAQYARIQQQLEDGIRIMSETVWSNPRHQSCPPPSYNQ